METIAHRGNVARAPENTMAAFRSAIDLGVDMVEMDLQLTRDGAVVVVHDEELGRTVPGKGQVQERTLVQLQELDAGGWFAPAFAGERIPTLEQVLDLFKPTPVQINLELKTNQIPYPGLAERVVAQVLEQGMEEQVILSSFNHETLRAVQQITRKIPCAALFSLRLLEPWEYLARYDFQALHVMRHGCTPEVVRECQARGFQVRVWTVNEEPEARRLAGMGVDGIITNDPAALMGWARDWNK